MDRSAAYEVEQLLLGGSRLVSNLCLYGTAEPSECDDAKRQLFPRPRGGLEASRPQPGWSFVQIPGKRGRGGCWFIGRAGSERVGRN